MAEALAILKSVKFMTDTLWEFAQLVRRYKHLPERLLDLEENLHSCEVTLQKWKTKWGVEERHPGLYYETLWSKRGWRAIRICMGAVDEIASVVKIKVNGIVGSAIKYQGGSRRKPYNGKFDIVVMRRAIHEIGKRMSRRRRFAWAVWLKADDLDRQIARFNTKLTNLERFADAYLFQTHPDLASMEPAEIQDRTQLMIENHMKEKVRSTVRDAREDAISLHRAYNVNDITCHIALARGGDDQSLTRLDARMEEDFLFLFSNGSKLSEITVHPVQYDRGSNIGRLPDCISDAAFAKTISSQRPGDLLPPGAKDGAGFELQISPRPLLTRLNAADSLSTLIGNSTLSLSIRDQINIATSLIEESYRLLGTPWLGYLSTTNMRGNRHRNGSWTAMLRCQPGNAMINRALAQFASQSANRTRDLSQHTQIFRLGIVLTEISLGSLVTYAEATDDIKIPGVNLVVPAIADDERLDADEIASVVEQRSGETYANLVRFCLSMLQSRNRIRQVNLDDDYESMLLKPVREMAQLAAPPLTTTTT